MQITTFKGLRNDKGIKFVPPEYFFEIENFNYDDLVGANKIKFPKVTYNGGTNKTIYGIFEFRFLNAFNVLITESLVFIGDSFFKTFEGGAPVLIVSGLFQSKWQAAIYKDKIFLTNGKDFPKVYNGEVLSDMGAPVAKDRITIGNLNGVYSYEMTYITASGEERIETRSNTLTITTGQVVLTLPIGYAGTTSRKIYRTEGGGSTLKLLTTIADNTTLTFIDNVADASLTTIIGAVNNRCPKPYFLEVSSEKLIGGVTDLFPTQLFVTGTNNEVFDFAKATDVSNQSGDNTPVTGMKIDYNRLVVGSEKEIYLVDVSQALTTITSTRSNIGMKDGYTVERVPSSGGFPGGILFVSTLNDVRLFSGNIAQPVATSLDNLRTENWTQIIQKSFISNVANSSNLHSEFFDYKYHLIVDQNYYVLDIRLGAWSVYAIRTTSFSPIPHVLGIFLDALYIGQKDKDIIEKAYQETTYRSQEVASFFRTPQILPSNKEKFIKSLFIYYESLDVNKFKVTITLDGNYNNNNEIIANFTDGAFDANDFDDDFFEAVDNPEDYKEIHINRWARWVEFKIEPQEGLFLFRGYRLDAESVLNKES